MLVKNRINFRNARTRNGYGIFSAITKAATSAATSAITKKVVEKALEGISKGIKQGAEHGAQELTKKAVDKLTKSSKPMISLLQTTGMSGTKRPKHTDADNRTRMLLDSLKSGSGIKTIF